MNIDEETTRLVMQIKTNVQNGQGLSAEGFESILSYIVNSRKEITKLETQLEHALETGGEYLEIVDILN